VDGFDTLIEELCRFYSGEVVDFRVALDLSRATPFQRLVWQAARRIPQGHTWSYGQLAVRIGNPRAARAVGQALARNPVPPVVPCHRVVGNRGLGGFNGGTEMKLWLLALEAGANSGLPVQTRTGWPTAALE
jgi:methylated-DNA-[protein]-cysteine S-methyltransferase